MMFTVIVVGAFAALVLFGLILRFTLSRNMNAPRRSDRDGTNGSGAGKDRSRGHTKPHN